MKVLLCAVLMLSLMGCGASSSSSNTANSMVNNWQFVLTQGLPRPAATISVSGFLKQSSSGLAGSVVVPPSAQNGKCAGVGLLSGTISGQNLTLAINEGGTVINLTGSVSSDGKSMQGSYSGLGGGCFLTSTSGTWMATQTPMFSGTFTGQLANSSYMTLLTGVTPPAPILVSGSFTQGPNDGSSASSTITGTINAVGYPCFTTASVTGTITGQNVYLTVYNYAGSVIGTIGLPGAPATVASDSSGISLLGTNVSGGLLLGDQVASGPCPALPTAHGPVPYDSTSINFKLQP